MDSLQNLPIGIDTFAGLSTMQIVFYALIIAGGIMLHATGLFEQINLPTNLGVLFYSVIIGAVFVATKALGIEQALAVYATATATYDLIWKWVATKFLKL